MKKNNNEDNLETMLLKLETIVNDMMKEETDLNSALEKYEQGINLYRKCKEVLDQAELKIETIKTDNDAENTNDI